jgi:SLOG cluster2
MKKENKNKVTTKDLDKHVANEIKETSKEKEIHLFDNYNIAISISDSFEIENLGFSLAHQKNLITEITRFLIIHGSNLIYGGDLRQDGYTRLFSNLVHQYRPSKEVGKTFFKNYFSFPIYLNLKTTDILEFKKNGVEPIKVAPPSNLDIDESIFYPPTGPDNLFIWSESLSKMRQEMQKITDARILTGGSMSNFKGKYPGLLEESILALKKDTPVYLMGIYGGITSRIIDGLIGKEPQELTIDWQLSQNKNYEEFVSHYNSKKVKEKIDYKKCTEFLNNYTLERLSKNNGLSIEENDRLFNTVHASEIIFLIMKGLYNTLSK